MTRNDALVSKNDQLQERARVLGLLEGTTPGEWQYRPWKHDDWGMVRGEDGHIVALGRNSRVGDEEKTAHREAGTDPYEANARLIAAAPDIACKYAEALAELERVTAERDAYRDALTPLVDLHNYPPPLSERAVLASAAWTKAEQVLEAYGCTTCAGQTFDDGTVCCWTCGREMPDASGVSQAAK